MSDETREVLKRYLTSIMNDVECMETNENPSIEEMWWNMAMGTVVRVIENYLKGIE